MPATDKSCHEASKASWPELRTSVEGAFESQKHLRRGGDPF